MWLQVPGSHHSRLAFTPTSMAFVPRDDLSYAICQVYAQMENLSIGTLLLCQIQYIQNIDDFTMG
jgi:hypothetical protein